ncbi:MAG: HD domain-containing protein [Candidatus Heimdallarchaeota archaeon]|nr:HD domain-containing protein [Candidatus Heimdallarchaeota archaeon]
MNILNLIPEINEIHNEELKSKTVKAFEKAITLGGWTEEDLLNIPFTLLIPELMEGGKPKINIIQHIRAVTQMCIATYNMYKDLDMANHLNRDDLISAGLLHDIGKFIEYERIDGDIVQTIEGKYIRHPAMGLELVYDLELPLIVKQAIVFHSKEGDKIERLPEVEIVHRCDFLCFIPVKKFYEK